MTTQERIYKMAKFKVLAQKPPPGTVDGAGGDFRLEMEALGPVGAEVVEVDARSEAEFIEAVRDADAIISRWRRLTKPIIDNADNCKVIGLRSVGADSVDVEAAT